jgi:hypothetical protein
MNGAGIIGKNAGLVFTARVFDVLSGVIRTVILTDCSGDEILKFSANMGVPKILVREIS